MRRREGLRGRALAAGLALGAAAPLTACFDALRDRTCDRTDRDCFDDEVCEDHRCVTREVAPDAGPDATAPARRTLEVRVFERAHGAELPSATVDFDDNDGTQCACLASATGGPCRLQVPATGTVRVCARAHGHRPCAVPEVPTSLGEVDVVLDPCPATGACDDGPGPCGCAGLPTCGTLAASDP